MWAGAAVARLWRRFHVGRNPLARGGDRLEARLLVASIVLALVAIPFAVSVGGDTYGTRLAAVQHDQASKHRATAVLLVSAPVSLTVGEVETVRVKARWQLPDGSSRVGRVSTYRGTPKGTEVPVWLDERGGVTAPPATPTSATADAVSVGVSVWLAVVVLCGLIVAATRALLARFHAVQWARDWAVVEREWSRR